jgi:hypothetical protein
MKKHCVFILLFASFHISSSQWVLQPKVTNADLYQVKFIDRNTGWAVRQFWIQNGNPVVPANKSSLLRTTDAGNSWTEQVLDNFLLRGLSCTCIRPSWTKCIRFVETTVRPKPWVSDGLSRTRRLCWSMQSFAAKMSSLTENMEYQGPRFTSGRKS